MCASAMPTSGRRWRRRCCAARAPRADGVAGDAAAVDDPGWFVALATAAPLLAPAPPATRVLGRTGPDRRQRASLVRGSGGALQPAGVHRRRDGPADAVALRRVRERLLLLRSFGGLSPGSWSSRGLLRRQAFSVPG